MKTVADLCKELISNRNVGRPQFASEHCRKKAFCQNAQALYKAMQAELNHYFDQDEFCGVSR